MAFVVFAGMLASALVLYAVVLPAASRASRITA
jgi:hypothetical protein